MGFKLTPLPSHNVQNLFALRGDASSPNIFAFAGHTDVVPVGTLSHWQSPPFEPTIRDGFLYGRGAADMKGSLAAMITACERFLARHQKPSGSIAFLITSDEEGEAVHGTQKIMDYIRSQNIKLRYCVVGEPTSHETVGDTIKVGRRGSMTGHLKIKGIQGHIAYPHRADNPIHRTLSPLSELVSIIWDEGDEFFPPTSFQISNIRSGTGAGNVIPGILECMFNFRFSPKLTVEALQQKVHSVLETHQVDYELQWQVFGEPFLTLPKALTAACLETIAEVTGNHAKTSTDGGTSDARFIAGPNTEVIELGPCNKTIHAVNECVKVQDLQQLSLIYEGILEKLLGPS